MPRESVTDVIVFAVLAFLIARNRKLPAVTLLGNASDGDGVVVKPATCELPALFTGRYQKGSGLVSSLAPTL